MTRIELGPTHGGTVAIAAIVLLCSVMGGPIGLAIGAVLAAAIVAVRLRRRLIVDDDGITTRDVLETRSIPWTGIDHYSFWSRGRGSGGGVVVGIVVALADRNRRAHRDLVGGELALHGRHGQRVVVSQRFRGVATALDTMFARLHGGLLEREDFTPFTLTRETLVHPTGSLPLLELERVELVEADVVIRKRSQRRPYLRLRMSRVRNVLLFAQRLADRGIEVVVAPDVYVPQSLSAELGELAARRDAVPPARVVTR